MMNEYRKEIGSVSNKNTITIVIPEYGLMDALPIVMETYKTLLQQLGSPDLVAEVILELVALARLTGADISEDKILAVENEFLKIYADRMKKRKPEF